MATKTCIACGAQKPLEDFQRHARVSDGRRSRCKPCQHEFDRLRRAGLRPPAKRGWRPGNRRTPERDGDRAQARRRVQYLVKHGRLPPPTELACSSCGQPAVAYSHRSYAAGEHEHVDALCPTCLGRRTRELGRGRGPDRQPRRRKTPAKSGD